MLISVEQLDPQAEAYWLIFSGDRLVIEIDQQDLPKGLWAKFEFIHQYGDQIIPLGTHKDVPCYVIDVGKEQISAEHFDTASMRSLFMRNSEPLFLTVARAWQLVLFKRTHRYCGQCGSSMQQVDWEMAMQCHRCGHRCYPRVSPCIIVAIRKGNKILLAQGKTHKERKMFSTLAGFVESGESLEQAVHREVFEEVGVKVKNLEYFGSQPWPFPHSLMVGFLAEHESGEILVDGHEILEAHWFDADELPFIPPNLSIAGQLIEKTVAMIKPQ